MVTVVKIWSQKQCHKMKTLLCLNNPIQGVPVGIKRNISLRNMKAKIMAFMVIVIQTILMKMMKTNIILEQRASLILKQFLLAEPIDTYKTLSMKEYSME